MNISRLLKMGYLSGFTVIFVLILIIQNNNLGHASFLNGAINISETNGEGRVYGYGHKASDGSLFAYYQVKVVFITG